MKAKSIMIQGTASSVGKSIIAAGLCRIFKEDGYRVVPFKSQNMALNSFITADGLEMGRAQVVQAEAAGVEPDVRMNPILLKPSSDKKAQVIINGKVHDSMSAGEYQKFKPRLREMIKATYESLAEENDIVVIEGAGSPAEINLRDQDFVNMGMAELAGAPVLLVGDIDKGGVFASLAGTMLLLSDEEKKRVKGVIINKFRGDVKILEPGLRMLEDIIKVPVIGVVPYVRLAIDDEDSVSEKLAGKSGYSNSGTTEGACTADGKCGVDIAIIRLPHLSNYTDFNALENIESVRLRYVEDVSELGNPDLIILPGTKNTIEDLLLIRSSGIEKAIISLFNNGVPVFGICGGYQMLGVEISDPHAVESGHGRVPGMGLLDAVTVLQKEKRTLQVEAETCENPGILGGTQNMRIKGYEIHMGLTRLGPNCRPFSIIHKGHKGHDGHESYEGQKSHEGHDGRQDHESHEGTGNGQHTDVDGACDSAGMAAGTYIHGIFDNTDFSVRIINNLRKRKGLHELEFASKEGDFNAFKQKEYDRLAALLRESLDMKRVYEIMNNWREGS